MVLKRALRHSALENEKFLRCLHKFEKQVTKNLMRNGSILKIVFQI
jgi:hypothetical protein